MGQRYTLTATEISVVRIHSGDGLHDYFAWATTATMSRYHRSAEDVLDGLHIPKWSWNGLVSGGNPPEPD